jgi:hypothetical protein
MEDIDAIYCPELRSVKDGWQLNSADLDGVVYAVPGVTYTLTYTVTEPLGSTAQARAKVVVGK